MVALHFFTMVDYGKQRTMKTHPHIMICRPEGRGGVAHYYDEIASYLPSRVSFFVIHDPKAISQLIKVVKLFFRLPYFAIRVRKVDLICLNPSMVFNSYYRDMALLTIAHLMGKSTAVFFRGWSLQFGESIVNNPLKRKLFQLSYGKSGSFIVLGNIFRNKLIELGVSEERIFNSTTAASFPSDFMYQQYADFDPDRSELRLLFLSRIVDGKGWMEAIDFANELQKKFPDREVTLVMAGEGDKKAAAECYAKNVDCSVQFPGYVSGMQKFQLFKDSNVFVLMSESEGLPNSLMEAMLLGLVVVATPVGAIPEFVVSGRNGVLVDAGIKVAVEKFVALMRVRNAFNDIMEENRRVAMNSFLPEHCARNLLKILDDTLPCVELDGFSANG